MALPASKIRFSTIQRLASEMLAHLNHFHLDVTKGPAPNPAYTGHGVRVVQGVNARWYREFCDMYQKRRGARTRRCDWCGYWHQHVKKKNAKRGKCGRKRPRQYKERKRTDTSIKRAHTVRGLEELMAGRCASMYAQILADFIERHRADLARWFREDWC
jgi:hypothetical protein